MVKIQIRFVMFRKEMPESIPEQEGEVPRSWDKTSNAQLSQVTKMMSSLEVSPLKSFERQGTMDMYKPFFLEYSLMGEYVLLHRQRISGAYILPSAGSALKWFGVLFIRQGLYQGGIFRFTLYIPDNFPDCDCPILVFEPPIFHPLIDMETGELDVKRGFPKWRRHTCHLWQVILFAKRIFYKIETQSPLNQEAALLYEKDLELYKLKVAENMNLCHEHLYERPMTEDSHAIWFCPWDATLHEEVRQKLLSQKSKYQSNPEENAKEFSNGLSWIQKGSSSIFSKKEL